MNDLETPSDPNEIYFAVDDDISAHRPMFTGDVYRWDGGVWLILQHPCALRRGVDLNPKILVAPVTPNQNLRSDWSKCAYKIMPLPRLIGRENYSADFVDLDLAPSDEMSSDTRLVTLSLFGVNLLLQRWLHHNSRVIVPTATLSRSTAGPFNEADLTEEWISDRVEFGIEPREALVECDQWLNVKTGDISRRDELADPQHASRIRREARQHWRQLG